MLAERWLGRAFPWGTLFVNVVGSALLGAIIAATLVEPPRMSAEARLLLGTGVMGGFTTYSSFNGEVLLALHEGATVKAAVYVVTTLVVCLAGAWAGFTLVRA